MYVIRYLLDIMYMIVVVASNRRIDAILNKWTSKISKYHAGSTISLFLRTIYIFYEPFRQTSLNMEFV